MKGRTCLVLKPSLNSGDLDKCMGTNDMTATNISLQIQVKVSLNSKMKCYRLESHSPTAGGHVSPRHRPWTPEVPYSVHFEEDWSGNRGAD